VSTGTYSWFGRGRGRTKLALNRSFGIGIQLLDHLQERDDVLFSLVLSLAHPSATHLVISESINDNLDTE
jgi:hypothetical protein